MGFVSSWIDSQSALGTSGASPGLSSHVRVDTSHVDHVKSLFIRAFKGTFLPLAVPVNRVALNVQTNQSEPEKASNVKLLG